MNIMPYKKYKGPYAWSDEITENNLHKNFYKECQIKYKWNEQDSCICQLVNCYLEQNKNSVDFEKIYPQIVAQSLQNCQKDKCYNNVPMPIFREIHKNPQNCRNLIKYDKLC